MTTISIPLEPRGELQVDVHAGTPVFLLGANGSGKSTLLQRFFAQNSARARLVMAHRMTSFESGALNLSPENSRQIRRSSVQSDSQETARYYDPHYGQRASMALYEISKTENARARAIAEAADRGDNDAVKALTAHPSPLSVINAMLRNSHLPIKIFVEQDEQIMATRPGHRDYNVAQLSDGERNALLLASEVLSLAPGALVLLDEPERHLHRSIISPLLTELFASRPDLEFVVATHDVQLPVDNAGSKTVLIRSYHRTAGGTRTWDADLVDRAEDIDDALLITILGSRKKILFVEGTHTSLDLPLYKLVFPDVTVVPQASCREVERAVTGVRRSEPTHWTKAFGLVDDDRRTPADIERLREQGVFATPTHTVESIYYHPEIRRKLALRRSSFMGDDAEANLRNAKEAALAAARADVERLSQLVAHHAVREEFMRHIPRMADMAAAGPVTCTVSPATFVGEERTRLEGLLATGDVDGIIARYPVRDTAILARIRERLGFGTKDEYARAVVTLLRDDAAALAAIRQMFESLLAAVEAH